MTTSLALGILAGLTITIALTGFAIIIPLNRLADCLQQIMHDINCIREDMDEFVDRKNK